MIRGGFNMWALCSIVLLALGASAVKVGDEVFTYQNGGLFYVFGDEQISIVDPEDMKVVATIDEDHEGLPLVNELNLTRRWTDAVYVEDGDSGNHYIFINEGDVYTDEAGNHSYVTVVDTVSQEIVQRIRVNPGPVHLYAIPELNEVWTHSDHNGVFDVIHVENLTARAEPVPALKRVGAHGKLLWDASLFPLAYATNVYEQYVFEIDLMDRELIAAYNYSGSLSDPNTCMGTHAIQYSKVNRHLYLECVGAGGILEWDTVAKAAVFQWENSSGSMTALPFENFVIAADKGRNKAHVFLAEANGDSSTHRYHVNVPGNPGGSEYFPNSNNVVETASNDTIDDYFVLFPLTRNTNKYNIKDAKAAGADVTDKRYASKPAGCKYEDKDVSAETEGMSTAPLMLATGSNGEPMTPECGACAPQTCDAMDAELSGFAVIDLKEMIDAWEDGQVSNATVISAGAVMPGMSYGLANECAYGRTYRSSKRGGHYIATVAHCPQPSLYVVDGTNPVKSSFVELEGMPQKVAYVPPHSRRN